MEETGLTTGKEETGSTTGEGTEKTMSGTGDKQAGGSELESGRFTGAVPRNQAHDSSNMTSRELKNTPVFLSHTR